MKLDDPMHHTPDRHTAARIIHNLAESGQPPKLGASFLNVGTEAILKRLRSDYLEGLLLPYEGRDGAGVCKWVEANYGNGKTQFLRCLQEYAWDRNYVTAFVELSQDECPLDRPERVYSAVARSLQAKPLTPGDVDRGRGIEIALASLLDRSFPGVLSQEDNSDLQARALSWLETSLNATPIESTGFRTAVVRYLTAKIRGDGDSASVAAAYLRGDPLPAASFKEIGIYEKLDKASGFRFLRSLCQLLQRSELAAGTVLLFDEARRSLSLMSTKAQKVACENLLSVINRCNADELPGTMFVYAVMPEFFTEFATAYPALQQRCGPSTRINLESLQGIREEDLLQRIGERIVEIFHLAFPDSSPRSETLDSSLRVVARATLRQTMVGSGTRRLFVKTCVEVLKQFRESGVTVLTEDEVERIMEGARQHLDSLESQAVASDGE